MTVPCTNAGFFAGEIHGRGVCGGVGARARLYEQFRFGFANAVSENEAKELYETFAGASLPYAAVPGGDRERQTRGRR
jgi:hypothetical protein